MLFIQQPQQMDMELKGADCVVLLAAQHRDDAEDMPDMTKQFGVKKAPTLVVNGKNQELIENLSNKKVL